MLIWQRLQYAIGTAIVLNKNQIPDFDIILRVQIRHGILLRQVIAEIKVYFGTRATRTSTPHLPEIIFLAQSQHAIGGQIRHARPELFSLLIGLQAIGLVAAKHRCPHAIFWQLPHICE